MRGGLAWTDKRDTTSLKSEYERITSPDRKQTSSNQMDYLFAEMILV